MTHNPRHRTFAGVIGARQTLDTLSAPARGGYAPGTLVAMADGVGGVVTEVQMDGDIDRAAVALLRKLKPEIQTEFLAGPEFRQLPDAERRRLYEIDAELSQTGRSGGELSTTRRSPRCCPQ
ncbi:hypothetical protein ABZ297_06285 [Nonomuraea sp. NPDC005983]|uniref:hypothetical protein n=1 Tax=Nonomuraea sp. NPDC005983 TaxID=3155595 RepID=UPI0033ADADD0